MYAARARNAASAIHQIAATACGLDCNAVLSVKPSAEDAEDAGAAEGFLFFFLRDLCDLRVLCVRCGVSQVTSAPGSQRRCDALRYRSSSAWPSSHEQQPHD